MTREEKEIALYCLKASSDYHSEVCEECVKYPNCDHTIQDDVTETIIKALEQETCEDCISRKALIERINHAEENFKADNMESIGSDDGDPFVDGVLSGVFNIREMVIQAPPVTPQEPKTEHCKDCKWWKDKDGVYRRGIGAESKCPINRREVMEGIGYCFMFEPQESEENDGIRSL